MPVSPSPQVRQRGGARGRGLNIALAPAVCSAPGRQPASLHPAWVFPYRPWGWMGAESAQPRSGHGAGWPEQGQPRVAPAAKSRWPWHAQEVGCGQPGEGGKRRGGSHMIFGGPQGFVPPPSQAQALILLGSSQKHVPGLCPFDPDSRWSKGSLLVPNPRRVAETLPITSERSRPTKSPHPLAAPRAGGGWGVGRSPHTMRWHPMSIPWRRGCPEGPSHSLAKPRGPAAARDPTAPKDPPAKQAELPPFLRDHPGPLLVTPALVTPTQGRGPPGMCPTSAQRGWLCRRWARRRKVGSGGPSLAPCPAAADEERSESRGRFGTRSVPSSSSSVVAPWGSQGGDRCTRAGTCTAQPNGAYWEPLVPPGSAPLLDGQQ